MKKKCVLLVVSTPPPTGGASVMNRNTVNILRKHGFPIIHINPRFALKTSDRGRATLRKVIELIRVEVLIIFYLLRYTIDKAYFNLNADRNTFMKDFLLMFFPLVLNKRIIIHLHCSNLADFYKKSGSFAKGLFHLITSKNVLFIILSENIRKSLDRIIPNPKMMVIDNGIEFPKYNMKRNTDEKSLACLFLSILIKDKGYLRVLETAKLLDDDNILFNIAGPPGPDYDERKVMDYLHENKLSERVIMHGPLFGKGKEEIYAKSDIFIFPTSFAPEAFPLVLLEAMAYGLCIISSAKGSIPEFVKDGENGYIIESNNPSQIAKKILQLKNDKSKLKEISRNNIEKFNSRFSFQSYEHQILRLFSA